MTQRRGGIIQVQVNGVIMDAKGEFSYGYGIPKREAIPGQDGIHGYKEVPQVAFIEGTITDRTDLDVAALFAGTDQTVTCALANDKTLALRNSWYAGDGQGSTSEGELKVRWESSGKLQEIS
jgi:hypothetical protein